MEIDILIETPGWSETGLEALAEDAFVMALAEVGLDPARFAVSLLACDDTRISGLNDEFRGKPTPTNVLSWPAEERGATTPGGVPRLPDPGIDDPPEELGDIALALETCVREAEEAGRPLEHHLTHLLVHGILHLLGFDHETDPDATVMERLETRILARLGVPDPY